MYSMFLSYLSKNFINSKRSKSVIDKGVWILDDKCNIYYHWLLDSLQRYMLLDESSKNYPVLIPKIMRINLLLSI